MWGGLFSRRTRRLSRRESLAAVPVLNPDAVCLTEDGHTRLVLRPTRPQQTGRWAWVKRLQPPRLERRFVLDAAGAEVLDLIDGRRTVEQIIQAFGARHKLPRETADYGVTTFLRTLLQRNLAAVVLPTTAQPDDR